MSVKTSCRTALLRLCAALAFVLSATTASAYTERNLLTGRADLETLKAALVADRAWVPYPAYADRQGWADFLGEYRDDYIRRGEKRLDYEWRVVRATDYLEFERSGNRDVGRAGRGQGALYGPTHQRRVPSLRDDVVGPGRPPRRATHAPRPAGVRLSRH